MKKRNLKYENNFRKYLYSFDFENHKEICNSINVNFKRDYHQQIKEALKEYALNYGYSLDNSSFMGICKSIFNNGFEETEEFIGEEHKNLVLEALEDYRKWFDEDKNNKDKVDKIDKAINYVEVRL